MPKHQKKILFICLCIISAGAFYLYYTYNPAGAGSYFPFPQCPSKKFLHLYCPGCGTQRAVHYLLHGNIWAAMRYNILLILLLPLSAVLVLQFVLRHFFDIQWDIALFRKNGFLYALGIILVLYMILRNVPVPALEFLRPPEEALPY